VAAAVVMVKHELPFSSCQLVADVISYRVKG